MQRTWLRCYWSHRQRRLSSPFVGVSVLIKEDFMQVVLGFTVGAVH